MPKYARVLVDQSGSHAFDYEIPAALEPKVEVGSRVRVPVRARTALATVIELADKSDAKGVRPIERVLGDRPALSPLLIRLAHWIADYYCCTVEVAMRSVLPQVIRDAEVGFKTQRFAQLLAPVMEETIAALEKKAPKQAAIVRLLMATSKPMPAAELAKSCGTTHHTLATMCQRGLLSLETATVQRDPNKNEVFLPAPKLKLNAEQSAVFEVVRKAIANPKTEKPILLYGVTGSGKTEIYLQAIEEVLAAGRSAIMLVPEISLTPQTVERFKSRFSALQNAVAVLHSHLSQGERHDEWHKINDGRARIVIGARSAIFAPMENLGLIVVDEEHENSYKQEEAPRYHGRDIAVLRGKMEGCAVILGSATPSMESYQNAETGKYQLAQLRQRVDNQRMPLIRIIDMRQEKQRGLISERLRQAISKRLERKEQSILFLNRRGFSTSIVCSVCGYVCQCPNCSISLTFHRAASRLMCHMCGHQDPAPSKCPGCADPKIRYSGAGTEKVEEAVARIFPDAVVSRMDADAMSRKEAYRERLHDFRTGKIDILVGTQMIAKGLHFPNVTLVGIINADSALHLPDFRAGERTFQLLTQVAGRAGRGDVEGEVFVQSFTPFHPSIQFARHHDFEGFWTQEIEFREKWNYPPYTHLVLITIRSPHEAKARFSAETLARRLGENLPKDTIMSDPSPAPVEKSHGNFRFQLMLRTTSVLRLGKTLSDVMRKLTFPEEVIVTTDVDAYQLL